MEDFYDLRDSTSHFPRYALAGTVIREGWEKEPSCDICGQGPDGAPRSLDVVITKGSKYPDILGCGAFPYLIVSERTVLTWRAQGVGGFDIFPVMIVEVRPKRLQSERPPEYFRVEPRGSCRVDVEASGFVAGAVCDRHHRVRVKQVVLWPAMRLVPGSWDGSDLFRDPIHFPRVTFCTRRLADICLAAGLKNFRFDRLGKEIDHGGKGDLYSG